MEEGQIESIMHLCNLLFLSYSLFCHTSYNEFEYTQNTKGFVFEKKN